MADRTYENELISNGYKIIAGTDEAGRGPLAGPLVMACVILPNDYVNSKINDSKKLSAKQRQEAYEDIISNALEYSIDIIDIDEIDNLNIYQASKKGMLNCVKKLKNKPEALITDCMPLKLDNIHVLSLVKGDSKSISVAAASIIAKVTRDNLMDKLDLEYPNYDFKNNKGYGTKKHIEAIYKFGITDIHRKTYEPIKSILKGQLSFDLELNRTK